MHIKKAFFKKIFFLIFSVFLLSGCYVENKLGRKFADSSHNISVLILEPDIFLKSNIKSGKTDTTSTNQDFLKDINEIEIIKLFMLTLKDELRSYGINVFTSNRLDTFFMMSAPAYLFNISQFELEEFFFPFKDKYTTDSLVYTQEFLLNAVNLNTWLEFSELNSEKKPELLFTNFYVKDDIDGDFKVNLLNDDVSYVYYRTDISPQSIETLTKHAGKTNARYIYNLLLNNYIRQELKDKACNKYFYYYDFDKKKILFLENYVEFRKI